MTERYFQPLASPFEVVLDGAGLIEAGAGTGKTWTIAALVLRLLLEERIDIERILVVTYTRAACGELRSRIRARLVEALAAFTSGQADEPYLQALVERHEAAQAQARLRLALESFDGAAIFTIHGFCQRALGETALAAGQPFERELIADQSEMLAACARDVWRKTLADAPAAWAHWLMNRLEGPAGLVKRVAPHLGRVACRVVAPPEVDLAPIAKNYSAAVRDARELWASDAPRILALLAAAPLNRQSYSPEKMQPRSAVLERWLSAALPLPPLPEGANHFGTQKMAAKLKKGGQLPEHPFFAAMDDLATAAQALESACELATRRLAADFLATARVELAQRKRYKGQLSYDDLLVELADALDGPAGERLLASLRGRYRVALVDEFQDTDALQLRIFSRLFGRAARPLLCVGDPKQAIYAFRGADVYAYLAARERADAGYALLDNRRSDPPLLTAINALFDRPRPFLLADLPYAPARPATLQRSILQIDDAGAPLTLWTLPPPENDKPWSKEAARAMAAAATAADIARLLQLAAAGRARLDERPLAGGDIAVLVRSHREGEAVRAALARYGIPCVTGGGGSLWDSPEAEELEVYLLALAAPTHAGRVDANGLARAALATVLCGADAASLSAWRTDEAAWGRQLERLEEDRRLLHDGGFMALWRRLMQRDRRVARLLARPDGERRLTNFRHLAELLQQAEQQAALDAAGLARHIRAQRATRGENEEALLRLESDARVVRIVTQHAAKGLQYPLAYCPFLWHGPEEDKQGWPVLAHREGVACLDFGSNGIDALRAQAAAESAAEELRLAYVALTRAQHRCVAIWGKVGNAARSPLAWLLFGPRTVEDNPQAWLAQALAAGADAAALRALESRLPGALRVLPLPAPGAPAPGPVAVETPLSPRPFVGRIPPSWRVWSFSALAARPAEAGEGGEGDEGADRDAEAPASAVAPAPSFSHIRDFPRGARAGSCLHALFERVDFARQLPCGPLAAELLERFGYPAQWRPVLEKLATDVLTTPLDADRLRLTDVPRGERLVELEFVFPLGPPARRAGYMKGFIDLAFRHAGRWYIVDWKSNRLEDYAPAALATIMRTQAYDLQGCIYAAALLRALAAREPKFDRERDFGGVYYLFVRGMQPDSTDGIHFFRPTAAEIDAALAGTGS